MTIINTDDSTQTASVPELHAAVINAFGEGFQGRINDLVGGDAGDGEELDDAEMDEDSLGIDGLINEDSFEVLFDDTSDNEPGVYDLTVWDAGNKAVIGSIELTIEDNNLRAEVSTLGLSAVGSVDLNAFGSAGALGSWALDALRAMWKANGDSALSQGNSGNYGLVTPSFGGGQPNVAAPTGIPGCERV